MTTDEFISTYRKEDVRRLALQAEYVESDTKKAF